MKHRYPLKNPDPELTQEEIEELLETTDDEIEQLFQGAMENIKRTKIPRCDRCGGELVLFVTDPDVVEDFCPDCDTIPKAAKPSGLHTFAKFVTKKQETE